jgi:uncharacterized BrkB/YihY/UPF0761 family membrane protein
VFSGFVIGLGLVSSGARWIQHEVGQTAGLLVSLAALAFYVGASFAAMNLLPHADAPWRALLPGTCVLAVGLVLLHIGVVLYLAPKIGRSTSLYGAFGAATVVLLWLYIIARLIVSAAFFNATLWDRRRRAAA